MKVVLPLNLVATLSFPNPLFPDLNLGGWYNQLTYKMLPLLKAPYIDAINQWREEVLYLPRRSWLASELRQSNGQAVPVLYSYSPHVVPQPEDWPQTTIATGYWFLNTPDNWQPPAELVEFLKAGIPPMYIGFGSMAGRNPEQLTEIVLEALAKSGQRGIIASGWGGLTSQNLPETAFLIKSVPHDWLFPQVRAVVHHGGAGTTAAGLRAGKPIIICPFFGDQPFWGRRVFELGVGTAPIPQKKLTATNLTDAIQVVAEDEGIRQRAAELGGKIRAEDGVARAVEFITKILKFTP